MKLSTPKGDASVFDRKLLPLVEDPAIMAGMGEDKGGGENTFLFPPPLTPPTEGGELIPRYIG